MAFKELSLVLTTSDQDIAVVEADRHAIARLTITNNNGSSARTYTLKHYKAATATTITLRNGFNINALSAVDIPAITLNEGDKIIALASQNTDVVITGSFHDTAKAIPFAVTGIDGTDPGYPWIFRDKTDVEEPDAVGDLNFNNAVLDDVTKIVLSAQSAGAGNPDIADVIESWDDNGESDHRGRLLLKNRNAPAQTAEFRLVGAVTQHNDGIDWYELDVDFIGGPGLSTDAELSVQFYDAGKKGAAGVSGASAMTKVDVVDVDAGDPATDYEEGDEIDGVTLVANMTVLRADDSDDVPNGVYVVQISGAAPRHEDFDDFDDLPGSEFNVLSGDTYGGSKWRCSSQKGGTIDTDPVTIEQVLSMDGANNGSEFTDPAAVRSNLGLGDLATRDFVDLPTLPQGRLTLATGVARPTSDLAAQTTIYYTAAIGNAFPLYDGGKWVRKTFSSDISLALDSNSGHTGYHQSGKNFDLFLFDDGGTLRLGTGPAWSSDTARGTGGGTTEVEMKDGLWVNTVSITLRFGSSSGDTVSVDAQQALLVGSFRATANGQATDSTDNRLLSNAYNAAERTIYVTDPASSWVYSVASYQQANANSDNRIACLSTLSGCHARCVASCASTSTNATHVGVYAGIGIDSSTVNSAQIVEFGNPGGNAGGVASAGVARAIYEGEPGLGYRELRWLEYGNAVGTSFYGTNSGASLFRPGMIGAFYC